MPYTLQYRVQFKNVENRTVTVNIYDTESWSDYEFAETMLIDLQPGGDPLHIVVVDNDEDKFSPIKSKRADIQFLSTNNYNAATFRGGPDDKWYVEVVNYQSVTLFKGYLSTGELEQPFLHNSTWQPVTLTAYDGLELLEDIPLTDFDGVNPKGRYKIMQYIAWCLAKTGIESEIVAVHNLREEHNPDKPMYESVYLDTKTFEDEVGTCVNCREVLEKILGHDAFITQYQGGWRIQRIDEIEWNDTVENRWSAEGEFLFTSNGPSPSINIGVQEAILVKGKETIMAGERPVKNVTLTYPYEFPKEIIDNIDFDRGDSLPLPAQNLGGGSTKFEIEDWTYGTRQGTGSTAYIRRDYTDDYEDARYIVMEPGAAVGQYYLISNPLPLHKNDKFTIGVDWRLADDFNDGTSSFEVMMVRFEGSDGTRWLLQGGNNPVWQPDTTGNWSMNYYVTITPSGDVNLREWQSASVDAPPLPVDGNLYVMLLQDYRETEVAHHFQNLQFDYKPFINGSYMKYKAQHHKVSHAASGYRKAYEEEVFISDSPKKLFKGALWSLNIAYIFGIPVPFWDQVARFYNAAHVTGTPSESDWHKYGYIQAFAAWNQKRREMRLIDASLFGIQSGDEPDLIHEYHFTDPHPDTSNKYFMLLHYDMDFKRCEWTGVFAETLDSTLGNSYDDPHEFRYITDK